MEPVFESYAFGCGEAGCVDGVLRTRWRAVERPATSTCRSAVIGHPMAIQRPPGHCWRKRDSRAIGADMPLSLGSPAPSSRTTRRPGTGVARVVVWAGTRLRPPRRSRRPHDRSCLRAQAINTTSSSLPAC